MLQVMIAACARGQSMGVPWKAPPAPSSWTALEGKATWTPAGGQWAGRGRSTKPHVPLAFPTVALPPEKADGPASGDEKRVQKLSESCLGPKKQLQLEVSLRSGPASAEVFSSWR